MAIQQEIWVTDIEKQLYQDSPFLNAAKNYDSLAKNKIVHVPAAAAGTLATTKSRNSFPASVTQRTDVDNSFTLFSFSTDPILITDFEETQLAYDKRADVVESMTGSLSESIGLDALFVWAVDTSAKIIRTNGALSDLALASGATGNRSGMTLQNFAKAKAILDNDKVPALNRFCVIPADMYSEFISNANSGLVTMNADYMNKGNLAEGSVNKVLGFDIFISPVTTVYATGATKKAVGAASVSTDNLSAIFFHRNSVYKAKQGTHVFATENSAEYYGSIVSAEMIFGAGLRNDEKGIVMIVQQ